MDEVVGPNIVYRVEMVKDEPLEDYCDCPPMEKTVLIENGEEIEVYQSNKFVVKKNSDGKLIYFENIRDNTWFKFSYNKDGYMIMYDVKRPIINHFNSNQMGAINTPAPILSTTTVIVVRDENNRAIDVNIVSNKKGLTNMTEDERKRILSVTYDNIQYGYDMLIRNYHETIPPQANDVPMRDITLTELTDEDVKQLLSAGDITLDRIKTFIEHI